MKKLPPKQHRFVEEYLTDLNATQAAIRAGYSAKTAQEQSSRLLSNVIVREAIEKAKKSRSERTEITADRVLHELAAIAFLDPGKVFTPAGEVRSLDDMDESVRRAIGSVETVSTTDGENISTVRKVRLNDKLRALELLGKHLALWVERVKLGGDQQSDPIAMLIQHCQGTTIKIHRDGDPVDPRLVNYDHNQN